jgi:hypothetical protein
MMTAAPTLAERLAELLEAIDSQHTVRTLQRFLDVANAIGLDRDELREAIASNVSISAEMQENFQFADQLMPED